MKVNTLLIHEFRRRVFDESYTRIFKCIDSLNEEQLWYRPNKNSNSIGNLILHLHGNMRQWMLSTFINSKDDRKRSLEFEAESRITKEALKRLLLDLKVEVESTLDIIKEGDLEKEYQVQVYSESGLSIMVHVIEHFSYHTGQIAFITKLLADKDLDFYPYLLE